MSPSSQSHTTTSFPYAVSSFPSLAIPDDELTIDFCIKVSHPISDFRKRQHVASPSLHGMKHVSDDSASDVRNKTKSAGTLQKYEVANTEKTRALSTCILNDLLSWDGRMLHRRAFADVGDLKWPFAELVHHCGFLNIWKAGKRRKSTLTRIWQFRKSTQTW